MSALPMRQHVASHGSSSAVKKGNGPMQNYNGQMLIEVIKEVPCEKIVQITVEKVVVHEVPVHVEHTLIKEVSHSIEVPVERLLRTEIEVPVDHIIKVAGHFAFHAPAGQCAHLQ